jgi:nitroreductase
MLSPNEIRRVVEQAIAAPSVHNTQPWLFDARAERIDVLTDPRRALPCQDPAGRELVISCGAASMHADLAVRGLGHASQVRLLPDPDRPELVARLVVGDHEPPSDDDLRLLQAAPYRHTDRSPFADWPVALDVLDELGAAAEHEGAWLQVLSTADMLELALWQAHARAELASDDAALSERAAWARADDEPADGVPGRFVPGWPAGGAAGDASRFPPATAADLVLVLGCSGDDRASWVRAGRALARVLLTGTAAGLVAAPATLALELPAIRHALSAGLALRGFPQMVLRTGYPAGTGTPRTGRRSVDDVLVTSG